MVAMVAGGHFCGPFPWRSLEGGQLSKLALTCRVIGSIQGTLGVLAMYSADIHGLKQLLVTFIIHLYKVIQV